MSERILQFDSIDELREWEAGKIRMPGGWFDEVFSYLVVSDGPITITAKEMRK